QKAITKNWMSGASSLMVQPSI
ncbi:mutS domain II family protein, partial [Vibrio parahaemolyticus AQ3810]